MTEKDLSTEINVSAFCHVVVNNIVRAILVLQMPVFYHR